jgi:hypothetical protein
VVLDGTESGKVKDRECADEYPWRSGVQNEGKRGRKKRKQNNEKGRRQEWPRHWTLEIFAWLCASLFEPRFKHTGVCPEQRGGYGVICSVVRAPQRYSANVWIPRLRIGPASENLQGFSEPAWEDWTKEGVQGDEGVHCG